jgi:hypothetical protein
MAYITGAVYDPPSPDLPRVAIVLDPEGQVLVARVVDTIEAGETFIQKFVADLQKKIEQEKARS